MVEDEVSEVGPYSARARNQEFGRSRERGVVRHRERICDKTSICGDVDLCVMEKREKEKAFVPGTDVLQRDGTARMRITRFWNRDT